ncbi:hypothetical protein [Arthrobacter sp. zg-Y1143]|uniref:hypothetical protein n=2 Tax=Arthrobacter TaxID=1663 RepID=UPI0024C2B09D|nr:hypothetical protein [Arthrobacter sp. zg-Y1143]MDK1327548.1 hypothetical protein [Arthrobacter sp. zg-Y1143]
MSENGKITAAQPSEKLIPKVGNTNWLAALIVAPLAVMVGAGIGGDSSSGDAADAWAVVAMSMVPVFLVTMVIFIVKISALRGKVSAAAYRIGESLSRDYGITVTKPKTLILQHNSKPLLNPHLIPAVDAYGRPVTITISTDPTGSRVIPTVVDAAGLPVQTHNP